VETVKKKLEVLRQHCRSVGRDYDSILKTKLGHVVIDSNKDRITEAMKHLPEERRREYAIYGTPEDVRKQIEAFREVGIEYLIVNLEPDRELQALDLFGSEVVKKL
jgi:alkanesulfonate monooxygenase SsuD/methylene tetrahydromethanopterin reductase-like flavin-dependent oxidoreductase (luciferase family)